MKVRENVQIKVTIEVFSTNSYQTSILAKTEKSVGGSYEVNGMKNGVNSLIQEAKSQVHDVLDAIQGKDDEEEAKKEVL